ncbi:MAG: cation:proton antiporter [Flavobacteriaceae bacterium]|nr:cation:proton antiporter [Flavobacteriaceae bacterium]
MLELGGIIILGILAQWLAWRIKIPSILPLILIGLIVGPISAEFFTNDGSKWIEPIWNGEKGLFAGKNLYYFVSLSISIILFEGGLTLRLKEIKNCGPAVITKLITLGSLVTFIGAAIAAHYVFGLTWEISFLFSALIIVTGPTVITPILRNIPLKKDVSAILKWESILIDPIGALVAVLVFEFISVEHGGGFTQTALIEFGKIILFGATFGFTFAHTLNYLINKKFIPKYLLNVFALAAVLGVFVLSDAFAHESGLLAVVVMGMVLGNSNSKYIEELLYFKESLSVLLISILFILLSANMNMDQLLLIFNWNTAILFAVIIFIIRPLGVFLSTLNSGLHLNEKLFISWVGPRGIVAAGIASLFGITLVENGVKNAEFITPLVFMVVLGTVLLNATTARFFAKISGVFLKKSEGILIVGASEVSRLIAKYLQENNRRVVLIDSNHNNVDKAKNIGLEAFTTDIYSDSLEDHIELNDIGFLLSLTGSSDVNKHAIARFKEQFGENGAFRLISNEEKLDTSDNPKEGLFSQIDDFTSLSKVVQENPKIHEEKINNQQHYQELIAEISNNESIIPLFIKSRRGEINILPASNNEIEKIDNEDYLVYVGKSLNEIEK